eukprot:scaffold5371_cov190-Skeletonema_marinoi.AAC.4
MTPDTARLTLSCGHSVNALEARHAREKHNKGTPHYLDHPESSSYNWFRFGDENPGAVDCKALQLS